LLYPLSYGGSRLEKGTRPPAGYADAVVLDRLADEIRVAFIEVVPDATRCDTDPRAGIRLVPPTHVGERPGTRGDLAFPVGPLLATARSASGSSSIDQADQSISRRSHTGDVPDTRLTASRLAELVAKRLERLDAVDASWAEAGFVNLRLSGGALASIVWEILRAGPSYGTPPGQATVAEDEAARGPRHRLSPRLGDALRYAHARLAGLLRAGDALGVHRDPERLDPAALEAEESRQLICVLADYPGVVARYLSGRARPRAFDAYVARFLAAVERFEAGAGPLPRGDEEPSPAHSARLLVAEASRVVAGRALAWCGLPAPDRM